MSVKVFLKNACRLLGEAPHWEEKTQRLLYVDIWADDMHIYDPITGQNSVKHFDGVLRFAVPRRAGGYVIGLGRQFQALDWDTGKTEVLGEVDQGTRNAFNDAKCDASGRLWAGTLGPEVGLNCFGKGMGSIYSLERNNTVRKHVSSFDLSNGFAWSLDNQIMYFVDSGPRKVYAFDFNLMNGSLSNQRVVIDYNRIPSMPEKAFPDGICIDQEGKLWVASYHGKKVARFDPNTGQQISEVIIPAVRVTSCCFGGKNYDEMYVTSAVKGADKDELDAYPLTGSVFKVTGLGTKGAPAPEFEG